MKCVILQVLYAKFSHNYGNLFVANKWFSIGQTVILVSLDTVKEIETNCVFERD